MATQSDYRVTLTLKGFDLAVTHLEWHEALSALFSGTLDVIESVYVSPSISDANLIDREVDITLWQGDTVKRRLHGVIDSVVEGGVGPRYRAYKLYVTPALQRLDHTANCRIFQLKTADEIISEILKQQKIVHFDFNLHQPKVQREYCVQYNETDLAFIERLAAEEGLIFWFEHRQGLHKLHFIDQIDALRALPGSYTVRAQNANQTEASIWDFRYREQRVTAASAQRDYTFKNPRYTLSHEYPGRFIDNQRQDYEHYSFNGRYKSDAQGKPFVQYRQEARQSAQRLATLTGDHLEFAAGQGIKIQGVGKRHDHLWFSISNHLSMPQPQALQEDAVGMAQDTVQSKVTLTTTCIPRTQPWRPQPKPKPVIDGPQMAHVVGPKGEEIFCDEFGRIRVQFPWDRYGNSDEYASCWIRVAQNWAGGQYGHMAIPRIGHEVIVAFLEGDPDQPIIMGRTYHQDNLPPYRLPQHKTRMTIKSKTHKGTGYNEIRFEDQVDKEQIYIHGQKDQDIIVENDRKEWIRRDQHNRIDNDCFEQIHRDSHQTVDRDQYNRVERHRYHYIGGRYIWRVIDQVQRWIGNGLQLFIGASRSTEIAASDETVIGADQLTSVAGKSHIKANNIVLEADQALTVKAPGGFIKIDAAGVTVVGKITKINSGGSADNVTAAKPPKPEQPSKPTVPQDADHRGEY